MIRFLFMLGHLVLVKSFTPQGLAVGNIRLKNAPINQLSFTVPSSSNSLVYRRPTQSTHVSKSCLHATTMALPLGPANKILLRYPLVSAFIMCAFKASAADIIAQISEKTSGTTHSFRSFFSYKRNFAFLLYGGLYTGMAQEILYNGIYPILFGYDTKLLTAAKKALFENFVIMPFLALPIAYIIKSPFYKLTFKQGFDKYVDDVKNQGLLKQAWSIWIPVQLIVFTVIPPQLRVVFVAMVSFFWFVLFSRITAKGEKAAASAK